VDTNAQILSDITVWSKYAKFIPELNRRETWDEIVTRNKDMHLRKFPHLAEEIENAYAYVYRREILPSMRSLQFAGKPIEVNNARLFNCSYLPISHPEAFSELMFLLLSGVGVGYSVQQHHIDQLPVLTHPVKSRRYLVPDSIEGWADAIRMLMKAYFTGRPLPDYDFSDIRPKGATLITSGGKAPGPQPLKDCIFNIIRLLDSKPRHSRLSPIDVHDINCYIADAVLAGGIRRSAMIALFDLDDEEMLTAKHGEWWNDNPQRGRANNSAVILRHKIKKPEFLQLWDRIEKSNAGEPGFFFTNDKDFGLNPCAEISLRPFQFCNLVTINASSITSQEDLINRARVAAFIATLQASYTNFHYLRDIWKTTTEKEALIGVSMTGIAAGNVLSFDLTAAANVVKEENARVAGMIGINVAARTTCIKPEGTTSLVVGSSSGIHAWHNDFYIRRMRLGKNEPIYTYLAKNHPELLEDDYFKPHSQAIVSVPIKAPNDAITREESALDLLSRVSKVWKEWIEPGHRKGANVNNVSATVTLKPNEWVDVGEWMWEHRNEYTALSVLPYDNGTYVQPPFEDIEGHEYHRLSKHLHTVDLTNVVEQDDNTNLTESIACSGANGCETVAI